MSNTITVTGNIGEPSLKFTQAGKPVLNLSLADNHSRKNQSGEWEQTGTTWYRLSLWDAHAQNAADILQKGDRVMVTGRVETRTYTDRDGQERESLEIQVQEIGKTISKRDAQQSQPSGNSGQSGGFGGSAGQGWGSQPSGGGWGGTGAQGGWDTPAGQGEEVPF